MPPYPVLTLIGMAALLAKVMNELQLISRSLMVPLGSLTQESPL